MALATMACTQAKAPATATEQPSAPSERAAPDEAPAPPTHGDATVPAALAVPGFGDAVIVAPETREPRPLFFAAHGAGDGPEYQCEYWAGALAGRFVVVCPRGRSLGKNQGGYYFEDHHALEREVLAVVERVRAALGARVSGSGGVYAGYSQGATMGALMLVEHGALFPRLLLIEGGSGEFTLARARRYRETGGESVAIVCGTAPCAERARRTVAVLERAGLRARAEHVTGGGHTYVDTVGDRALAVLSEWLAPE